MSYIIYIFCICCIFICYIYYIYCIYFVYFVYCEIVFGGASRSGANLFQNGSKLVQERSIHTDMPSRAHVRPKAFRSAQKRPGANQCRNVDIWLIEVAYGKVPLRSRAGGVAQPKTREKHLLLSAFFSKYVWFDRSFSSNIFKNVKNDAAYLTNAKGGANNLPTHALGVSGSGAHRY